MFISGITASSRVIAGGGGGSSPALVQTSGNGSTGLVSSITVDNTHGWATPTSGNLLVAFVSPRSNFVPTAPTGWSTKLAPPNIAWDNLAVFYKISDGTESSITSVTGDGNRYVNMHVSEIENANSIIQASGDYTQTSNPSKSLTGTVEDNLILAWYWSYGGSAAGCSWTGSITNELEIDPVDTSSTGSYTSTGGTVTATTILNGSNPHIAILEIGNV